METVLPGHHSKSIDICQWVIDNYSDKIGENKTLKEWVEQSQAVIGQINN